MANVDIIKAFQEALQNTNSDKLSGNCKITWKSRRFPKGAFKRFLTQSPRGSTLSGRITEFCFKKPEGSNSYEYSANICWERAPKLKVRA